MKKILTVMAISAGWALSSYGQGEVLFATGASASTKFSTNSVGGGASTGLGGGGLFDFALFYAPTGTTNVNGSSQAVKPGASTMGSYVFSDAAWQLLGYGTNNPAGAGKMLQSTALDANGYMVIPGVASGSQVSLVVLGWSDNLGSTVSALEASLLGGALGYLGQSAVANITAGGGGQTVVSPFGSLTGQVGGVGMGLTPVVPEPATFALAGLGAAAMLIFRRRK